MSFEIGNKHKVLCSDGKVRTAVITGHPETIWTVPASIKVSGKAVSGWIWMHSDESWRFSRSITGKNHALIPAWPKDSVDKKVIAEPACESTAFQMIVG